MSQWSQLLASLPFPNKNACRRNSWFPQNHSRRRAKNRLSLETLEERVVLSATLFSDTFDSTDFNAANWADVGTTTIDDVGVDEPSAPYAARINGASGTGDTLVSTVIDLSGESNVTLNFNFQRGGGGNVVEMNNDLVVEYLDASGNWVELTRKLGLGSHMQEFGLEAVDLPQEALHANFQFRFVLTGSSNSIDTDDWFVDDVELRSVDEATGPLFSSSQTQDNNFFYPQVLTFDFGNLPAPGEDATLTIRATGDLNSFLENAVLRADGEYIDQLFLSGGLDNEEVTVTLTIPQSVLERWAADGTVSFTLTPSALVQNIGPSSVTLELSYHEPGDTDPPEIQSVTLSDDNRSFVVQMNDDDLNGGSATDINNFQILKANGDANGDGDPFNDGDETFVGVESVNYDAATDRITVVALNELYDDEFRFIVEGSAGGGLQDLAGNLLSGGDHVTSLDLRVDDGGGGGDDGGQDNGGGDGNQDDGGQVGDATIAGLIEGTQQLDLPCWLQHRLLQPLKAAMKLSEHGNGHPRAVSILLGLYSRKLDWALAKGKISDADHEALSVQTDELLDDLQVQIADQSHHRRCGFHLAHRRFHHSKPIRWFRRC